MGNCKALGTTRHHYAIPNGDFDSIMTGQVESTGIEPFLDAVEKGIVSANVASLIPGDRPFHAWLIALAWLTRDQECRFINVLVWRSADSDSGSPARGLSSSKTLDALRALIGAITPAEYQLRSEIAQLELKLKESVQEIGHGRWEVNRLQSRLAAELELSPENLPAGRFAVEALRQTARERLARVAVVNPSVDLENLDALRTGSEEAQEKVADYRKELAEIDVCIPHNERMIARMKGELPAISFSIDGAENPQCPVCEVPIDRILADGCKLSHKLPNPDEIREQWENLKNDISKETEQLNNFKQKQVLTLKELESAQQHAKELKSHLRAAERIRDDRADAWYKARRVIDEAERLDGLLMALEQWQSNADKFQADIETKRGQSGAHRNAQESVILQLSLFFHTIIQYLAGNNTKGRITLDGNGVKLSVELGGERSTTAINSLKVIVFDLAVMCMSIEGHTHTPAFIIHDSPREADLGLSIYHQIFRLARFVEQVGGNPLFQYIVTTTTRPPDELSEKPWLRDILKGAPAEARLLRHDL
jgi:hypothetical protein